MTRPLALGPALLAALLALPAAATPVAFDGSWREQGFLRLSSNDYRQGGGTLGVTSDGTVSLLWKAVPDALRGATRASWGWAVSDSVPATDLRRKGGDDRNLALYFAFTTPEAAARADPSNARRLLRDPDTRILVYVWGGQSGRGTIQASPYLQGMRTVVLRPAGTGQHVEQVDLAADHARAFGTAPGVLVGLGVSADADDTDSLIRGSITAPDLR
ncbi:DUF3047 domain-containing protein [Jannaschia sp. Os4]|uniref:DUF3047 domain-containing protein n=1 Tax=Jannaschia sp. Os4 TaxID=2807617 RepID=UPI00193A3006|nr:DUF3047 domain-containing protein [Jannaschia sp. Os4]MBM2574958.1 DUF3047 domain-containing protein [Jannaschia sp. Os4]